MAPRVRLGTTDLIITRVGFGAWAVAGGEWLIGWGPQSDQDSIRAIRHAVGLGLNWIDTSPIYGYGHSEAIVARALADIPQSERPLIFTKCGRLGDPNNPFGELVTNLHPDSIERECESSLRRLGVDAIDLYQIHWPNDTTGTPLEESWGAMVRLVDDGKVRAIGVSNFDVDQLERCEGIRHVDSVQPPFSLLRRESAASVIPWAIAHTTGVIVYSPMHSGLLTSKFSVEYARNLAITDWRRKNPDFQAPKLDANLALRDALVPIAKRHGLDVGAIAVAWTLACPGVTGAIVGARTAEQVEGWASCIELELQNAELAEIAAAIGPTNAGDGPAPPKTVGLL
jgi:aryl-alcohol dehydrogenase-like predicted oxidoreductase